MAATCLIYVLLVYAIHEAGHIIAIYLTGHNVSGAILSWRGIGIAWQSDGNIIKQIAVSLSGPAANLIAFAACGFSLFGLCNLIFAVGNLLFPGSDGMKAIRLLRSDTLWQ